MMLRGTPQILHVFAAYHWCCHTHHSGANTVVHLKIDCDAATGKYILGKSSSGMFTTLKELVRHYMTNEIRVRPPPASHPHCMPSPRGNSMHACMHACVRARAHTRSSCSPLRALSSRTHPTRARSCYPAFASCFCTRTLTAHT